MKIAMAQMNSWLGDFAGNREKILHFISKAKEGGIDLVVFPEACLFGYHPCDLLERPGAVAAELKELKAIQRQLPAKIAVVLGAIGLNSDGEGKPYINAAVFLEKGRPPRWFAKQLLPTYDVFDEGRHIEPGIVANNVIRWKDKRILFTICEDIWAWPASQRFRSATYQKNPLLAVKKPIDLVINISASPYTTLKLEQRRRVTRATAKLFRAPVVYVNMIGAQDELIFDGGSFAINPKGQCLVQAPRFQESFSVFDFTQKPSALPAACEPIVHLRQALVLGLRDFVRKTGFKKVHLGLSGGIDSAVVACLAAEALGPKNVRGIGLPGPFSDPKSLDWARELASNLGIEWSEIPITPAYENLVLQMEKDLGPTPFATMHENLQARLRCLILMAYSNRENSMLLATSNKDELATGYSTLYGDMSGGLMPIGDLLKGQIYELALRYNKEIAVIPHEIIDRPPSAELRPNQRDQDTLPPYPELDSIVEKIVSAYRPANGANETKVLRMLMTSEFKRWQAPPILKVSDHAFGRGRRLPVAHRAQF